MQPYWFQSIQRRRRVYLCPSAKEHKRFILIPAYRRDAVIHGASIHVWSRFIPPDCLIRLSFQLWLKPTLPQRFLCTWLMHFGKTSSQISECRHGCHRNDYDIAGARSDNASPYDYLVMCGLLWSEVGVCRPPGARTWIMAWPARAISEEINNTISVWACQAGLVSHIGSVWRSVDLFLIRWLTASR